MAGAICNGRIIQMRGLQIGGGADVGGGAGWICVKIELRPIVGIGSQNPIVRLTGKATLHVRGGQILLGRGDFRAHAFPAAVRGRAKRLRACRRDHVDLAGCAVHFVFAVHRALRGRNDKPANRNWVSRNVCIWAGLTMPCWTILPGTVTPPGRNTSAALALVLA